MRRLLKWLGIFLGVLALAVVVLVLVFDWNWVKNYAARKGSELTGRQLSIDDLDVDLGWRPLITLNGVRFENAAWSEDPWMVDIRQLRFRIVLKELLKFRTVLPEVDFTEPKIILELNAEGAPNWEFTTGPLSKAATEAAVPEERAEFPVIGELTIDDGRVIYRDPGQGMDITAVIATARGEAEGGQRQVEVSGEGRYQGEPFKLEARGGSLLSLRESEEPYPLRVEVTIGATHGRLDGTLQDPLQLAGPDLSLFLKGPDPAQLFPILGIPLPTLPPYQVEGRLTREADTWIFRDFAGRVGDSDVAGFLSVDTGRDPKFLKADVTSRKLDFDDLAGLVGGTPDAGETASEEQKRKAAQREASGRLLPDDPIDLEKLRAMDAEVKFRGKQVIAPKLPLSDLTANLQLRGGRLIFDPLNFGIDGGTIHTWIDIDGSRQPPRTALKFRLNQIDLRDLLKRFEIAENSAGTLGGRGDLHGSGASAAKFLGSASGDLALIMNGGKLDGLLVELAGLDFGEALIALTAKERDIDIRCVVGDFRVKQGVMNVQTLVIDTTDTNITAEGAVNFRDESLNLTLKPHPKDVSILTARTPIDIDGTFKDPAVAPKAGPLAARGAAAAALGALLTPLAALVALVEPGGGEDADCRQLIESAKGG
ncbi:MAG: AsmA family protein [Pseudomonadota bacterium]|nr:AsmA family protein [Pseudomonadota bacterium]